MLPRLRCGSRHAYKSPQRDFSNYEQLRAENIAKNEDYLRNLGLMNATPKVNKCPPTKKARIQSTEPSRHSSRLDTVPPANYVEE